MKKEKKTGKAVDIAAAIKALRKKAGKNPTVPEIREEMKKSKKK